MSLAAPPSTLKIILLGLPLGNIEDLSFRVKKALQEGKLFFVEDTRTFKALLSRLNISLEEKIILSFHDHSGPNLLKKAAYLLQEYKTLYIASEAGSPLISDPAFPLLEYAHQKQWKIETYPGPSAVIAALELSTLSPCPFAFWGFFPRETSKRQSLVEKIRFFEGVSIFFESPLRVEETVEFLSQNFPMCDFSLVKEISKPFESSLRFQGQHWASLKNSLIFKGEWTILLENQRQRVLEEAPLNPQKIKATIELANDFLKDQKKKTLAKLLGLVTGKDVKEIYKNL